MYIENCSQLEEGKVSITLTSQPITFFYSNGKVERKGVVLNLNFLLIYTDINTYIKSQRYLSKFQKHLQIESRREDGVWLSK